ncbi:MAG: ATP-binding cassette domain-containing protein, partial [Roseibium sp.]|uniref:peptidase domain-containing ABC transporter n=1 Tax=Roseibium sp. TaxID=1936156 RepID=UPI0026180633
TIGQLIAFNMFASHVNGPILRLAQLWRDFQEARISVDRLGDILNCPTELGSDAPTVNLPAAKGGISFQNVSFRYAQDEPEVLSDVSFEIQPGQSIGLVGASGSGKSTLTKLVQRLYTPERGRVLIDGTDLSLVDPSWLRSQIGVVLQDNILFNRSVQANIALGNPTMPMSKVIEVSDLAAAHEFIVKLPRGYETIIEERGMNLSGGQRQRIAIARALALDPPILIFDEATSALDYYSERQIRKNMRKFGKDRTVLLVAHRLSTVRNADRILVFDRGRIVEQGTHNELVNQCGLYAGLVAEQAG